MRDLTSRLREIVRRETTQTSASPTSSLPAAYSSARSPLRELTYVPNPDVTSPRRAIAPALGGLNVDDAEPVEAAVRVVDPAVRFGILSDVDDTVMVTALPCVSA